MAVWARSWSQGWICCLQVFAYGQTGSGKTFAMGTVGRQLSTSGESDGIISRSMRFVFDKMKEIKQQYDVSIKVSSQAGMWSVSRCSHLQAVHGTAAYVCTCLYLQEGNNAHAPFSAGVRRFPCDGRLLDVS